jgi:hypothetical protein
VNQLGLEPLDDLPERKHGYRIRSGRLMTASGLTPQTAQAAELLEPPDRKAIDLLITGQVVLPDGHHADLVPAGGELHGHGSRLSLDSAHERGIVVADEKNPHRAALSWARSGSRI